MIMLNIGKDAVDIILTWSRIVSAVSFFILNIPGLDMGFKDECGVAGIFGVENAAGLSYFALTSLQHRGQESAGIAVSNLNAGENEKKISLHKGKGLVGEVFKQSDFEKLKGSIAVAHVRYATAGGRTIENAQPFLNTFKNG